MKQIAKKVAYSVSPDWVARVDEIHWLRRQARDLAARAASCHSPQEYVDLLAENPFFPASQNRSEILRLLEIVAEVRPRRACEIGSYDGGTLFLFSQVCDPRARVISIDIDYQPAKRPALPCLAGAQRRLVCVEANSQLESARDRVRRLLGREMLDFLFIDGDHSLEGVSRDFELYSPLVRVGGIIALHDIVPDAQMRTGTPSTNWVGEVPLFWERLKTRVDDWTELVEDPDQDGYGIGVIRWRGTAL